MQRRKRRSSSRENLATLRKVDAVTRAVERALEGKVSVDTTDTTLRVDGAVDVPLCVRPGVSQAEISAAANAVDDGTGSVRVHVEPGPHKTSVWFVRVQRANVAPWNFAISVLVIVGVVCLLLAAGSALAKYAQIDLRRLMSSL